MSSNNLFNETESLQQLSQGSEIAFEKIYNFYSERLYNKILRLIKSDVLAEEILQDVFLVIWENRANLNPEKSFCAFLFCIATNKCYDYFRKIIRDKELLKSLNHLTGFTDTVEEIAINKESSGLLCDAIDSLPPKRKLIFQLCKIEGKSYQEVSRQLDISLSTISDHIVKANHFIKDKIIMSINL